MEYRVGLQENLREMAPMHPSCFPSRMSFNRLKVPSGGGGLGSLRDPPPGPPRFGDPEFAELLLVDCPFTTKPDIKHRASTNHRRVLFPATGLL